METLQDAIARGHAMGIDVTVARARLKDVLHSRRAPGQTYAVGGSVYVRRSNGEETAAMVKGYDEHRPRLQPGDQGSTPTGPTP